MMNFKMLALFLLGLMMAAVANSADLNIILAGVNGDEGRIRLALYGSPKTFGKEKKAVTIREVLAQEGAVKIIIRNLPPGQYAVQAYHDRNGNGNFDHMLGLLPSEGYGLSNNHGEGEDFADAAFDMNGQKDLSIEIQMRYCGKLLDGDKKVTRVLSCWASMSP